MGLTCSKPSSTLGDIPNHHPPHKRWKKKSDAYRLAINAGVPDPEIYHFLQRSVQLTQQYQLALQEQQNNLQEPEEAENRSTQPKASSLVLGGQYHLLYKQQQQHSPKSHHTFEDLVTASYAATSPPQEQRPPSKKAQHRLGGAKSAAANSTTPSTAALKWPHSPNHKQSIQYTLSLYDIQFRTKLVMRRHGCRPNYEEGHSGTHVYAIRWPMKTRKTADRAGGEMVLLDDMDEFFWYQQQEHRSEWEASTEDEPAPVAVAVDPAPRPLLPPEPAAADSTSVTLSTDHLFHASTMALPPKRKVVDWVTVSAEHKIYVADVGLTMEECNRMVLVTEQQCRGQYAAYTYAKQTLGCREFPLLACTVQDAVHTVVSAILEHCGTPPGMRLALDDREPHMVKYDVTKKERQKLDMHTDKSEWTFLIAISNGAGLDYMGGGTYFECLDATVHVQRGHALIFPGRLRHCGQRIMAGLRFLLVGFLVDKTPVPKAAKETTAVAALVKEEDENETEVIEDHQRAVLYSVP